MSKGDYMELIHTLPCVLCWKRLGVKTFNVHAHHAGEATDRDDWLLIPLCHEHHQGGAGIHGLHRRGFHRFWKTTDMMLVAWTNEARAKFGEGA